MIMCNVKGVARSIEPTEALADSLAKFFSNIWFFFPALSYTFINLHFHL